MSSIRRAIAYVLFCFLGASTVEAQAARLGRLPVLALPASDPHACKGMIASPTLQQEGIARIFSVTDSMPHRLLLLALRRDGTPFMLQAMMSTHDGRRGEGESVTVFFGVDGSIVRGIHNAFTTGTPSRLDDDRKGGLLPNDSAKAEALARALKRSCHA